MNSIKIIGFISIFCSFTCCIPIADNREITEIDLHPPQLIGFAVPDSLSITMDFNKPTEVIEGSLHIIPLLHTEEIISKENSITIAFTQPQVLGQEYHMEISVEDSRGNSTDILTPFYGYNPEVPLLCINEFTTQGSSSHPDVVELFAHSAGNLAGTTIYEGTKENWEQKMVLPPLKIRAGDFMLIHFKPQGKPEEINETENIDASGGLDASPSAYDFWVPLGSGLSGNNGVIALYTNPQGDLLDALLYSNRTSLSDEKYRGFGSIKVMERADELAETGGWETQGDLITPEDGINPDDSTSTRSMCRDSSGSDSNSKNDWHIVPTGTYSFGDVNSDAVYIP